MFANKKMLKYLLHSSKSTLGADNKYRYNLDKKLGHDAKTMVLVTLSYSCHSGISPAPHVVYAHSDALSRIIHRKHTVELQDQSHDRSSNIIAVLKETHTRGRYQTDAARSFRIDNNEQLRQIDIYFTDGAENSSREFDRGKIFELVTERQKAGWTFVFLGANIDSYATGGAIGYASGSTSNYHGDAAGMKNAWADLSKGTSHFRTRSDRLYAAGFAASFEPFPTHVVQAALTMRRSTLNSGRVGRRRGLRCHVREQFLRRRGRAEC